MVIIQLRRDTASNWTSNNPVLAQGELGIELDTGKAKLGDGVKNWNTLDYYNWGNETTDVQVDGVSITSSGVANLTATNLASPVRGVRPAYTAITATASTYTLSSNATFGQTPSQAVTYTLPVFDSSVDCWVKLFIDTTNSASVAFTTTDNTSINPDGTTSIVSGHKYIVIVQSNSLKSCWEIYIIDGGAV